MDSEEIGKTKVFFWNFVVICSDHFRKNIPYLAEHCKVYSIDLLGYGYSDKPDPQFALSSSILFKPFAVWETIGIFTPLKNGANKSLTLHKTLFKNLLSLFVIQSGVRQTPKTS